MLIPLQAETPVKYGQWINWLIIFACLVFSIIGFYNSQFFIDWSGLGFRENPEKAEKLRKQIRAEMKEKETRLNRLSLMGRQRRGDQTPKQPASQPASQPTSRFAIPSSKPLKPVEPPPPPPEPEIQNPYLGDNTAETLAIIRGDIDPEGDSLQQFAKIIELMKWRDTVEPCLNTSKYPRVLLSLTSSFLHDGWMHLLMNLLFLWVFGNAINTKVGPVFFPIIYFASAMGSGLLHYYMTNDMAAVGASGAIYGVIGAFLVIFTNKRIKCVLLLIPWVRMYLIPGSVIIVFWVLWDLFMIHMMVDFGVALWGHVGGFATGFLIALVAVLAGITERDPKSMERTVFDS